MYLLAICYPGRMERCNEKPMSSVKDIAISVFLQIIQLNLTMKTTNHNILKNNNKLILLGNNLGYIYYNNIFFSYIYNHFML